MKGNNLRVNLSILCLVLLVGGKICLSQTPTANAAPGEFVDVQGYKIHLLVDGKRQDGPTVVFFHGARDIGLIWKLVLPKVGTFARAVAIDQNGEGWSEHGYGAALNQQVSDSHQALHNAGFNPPYILVGHSLGGILTLLFAKQYPTDVVGVVMVDATHPDVVLKIFNPETKKMEWKQMRLNAKQPIPPINNLTLTNPPELSSFTPKRDFGNMLKKFSNHEKALMNWIYNERPWTYVKGQGNTFEAEFFADIYANRQDYFLKDIPLFVMTGSKKEKPVGDLNWTTEQLILHSKALQTDLLNFSNRSKQIIAKKSGHYIHLDQPELVAKSIKEMLKLLNKSGKIR